jgi:hypothetical protein
MLQHLQPTLNQRYAATEREQTRLNVALFINVFGIFRWTLAAHNGAVARSDLTEIPSLGASPMWR